MNTLKRLKKVSVYFLFVPSILLISMSVLDLFKSEQDLVKLKESVEMQTDKDKKKIDFKKLKNINPDIVAWLEVDNTDISFPVLQGKDNKYYLTHAYDRTYSKLGSIFLDSDADKNFTNRNTFIYGHNVYSTKKMFSFLENYMSVDFYTAHSSFSIYTTHQELKAKIFSVYEDQWDSFSYQTNIDTNVSMLSYIKMIKEKSIYDTGIEVKETDNIITFYTCSFNDMESGNVPIKRYYVHAVIK